MNYRTKCLSDLTMTKRMMNKFLLLLISVFLSFGVTAQDIPQKPNPPKLVNDFANVIDDSFESRLEQELVKLDDSTTVQITIVTVNSLNGYDPSMFAFELGEKWGVGSKEFNNGVVVLIKPKRGRGDKGHAFIAPGYGLEGAIPDAIAKQIVENEMIPQFKKGNYEKGIAQGAGVLINLAKGEYSPDQYAKQAGKKKRKSLILPGIFLLLFFIIFIAGWFNRARHYSMGHDVSFWSALMLMSMTNSAHRGSWNNFHSGGGSFGGGGGFGGFGGGSFGGGGAGGSW
ncbi:TPM domain-containing protein [Salibacter sp.]|uniref:TPM domain-containing protein n=1 Tax=Salibacter sp. TaxID=2010995 RepID=UPI00286FF87C|nr:TPM domain-containing protein [Salibacter sp.]MDR9487932.1 TPM domain-containing protein [Salibacter sp.]